MAAEPLKCEFEEVVGHGLDVKIVRTRTTDGWLVIGGSQPSDYQSQVPVSLLYVPGSWLVTPRSEDND